MRRGWLSGVLFVLVEGCGGGGGTPSVDGATSDGGPMLDGGEDRRDAALPDTGPPEGDCLADGECDDGVGCTEDVCYSPCGDPRECGGFCSNDPDPSRCAVGESCDSARGCVPSR